MMMPAAVTFTSQNQLPVDYRRHLAGKGQVQFGPVSMGAVPLIVAGAAVGGAGAVKGAEYVYAAAKPWYHAAAQWVGWEAVPEVPVNQGMPGNRAPVAPQTEAAMRTWTPEQMNEALEQRNRQYGIDMEYYRELVAGQEIAEDGDAPTENGIPSWAYLAAISAVGLVLALKK